MKTSFGGSVEAVVIGGSAGAVEALGVLLPTVPADIRIPVIVLIHLPPGKASLLVEIYSAKCRCRVTEPYDKQPIEPGIWIAPPDYHLLVESDRSFSFSLDEPVHFSRPSIDVLFESAADVYGKSLVAVVLTGASRDGAAGARRVREAGGTVLVQDPTNAQVDIMPRAAMAEAHVVGPLSDLATTLGDFAFRRTS